MTMIHRVLIMNIIHVLAHGNADEIRLSDMDNKLLYMLVNTFINLRIMMESYIIDFELYISTFLGDHCGNMCKSST